MAYKRYAKKNGKVYGPYYYESYRENGVVKKIYIGQKDSAAAVVPRRNLFLLWAFIFALAALILIFGLISLSSTGKVTLQTQPSYGLNEFIGGQISLSIEQGDSIQKDTQMVLIFSKDNHVLVETTMTLEEFLGSQINYVEITNDSISCINTTVSSNQEVCSEVTTPGETTEVCNSSPQEVCHDEQTENGTIQVCITEYVQVCENVTSGGTTDLVCSNQTIETEQEN